MEINEYLKNCSGMEEKREEEPVEGIEVKPQAENVPEEASDEPVPGCRCFICNTPIQILAVSQTSRIMYCKNCEIAILGDDRTEKKINDHLARHEKRDAESTALYNAIKSELDDSQCRYLECNAALQDATRKIEELNGRIEMYDTNTKTLEKDISNTKNLLKEANEKLADAQNDKTNLIRSRISAGKSEITSLEREINEIMEQVRYEESKSGLQDKNRRREIQRLKYRMEHLKGEVSVLTELFG